MKARNILVFTALISSLLLGSCSLAAKNSIIPSPQQMTVESLELVNHTHYGDLTIEKGKQLIVKANEVLIIDGDLVFEKNTALLLENGGSLIIIGDLYGDKRFEAEVNGFMLAKQEITLRKKAILNGNGELKVAKALHLDRKAECFGKYNCFEGPRTFAKNSNQMMAQGVEDSLSDKNTDKGIKIGKLAFQFRAQPLPMESELLLFEKYNTDYEQFDLSYDIIDRPALVVTFTKPKSEKYKISLSNANGKILSRKLVIMDATTYQHEEEIMHGLDLASGDYFIKVHSTSEQYILPFTIQ